MNTDPKQLIGAATSSQALARLSKFVGRVTFRIKTGTAEETIVNLDRAWQLKDKPRQKLLELGASKAGASFIDEKVQAMNQAAFHRSAFALNAITQLLFVNLAVPELKAVLVAANLALAGIAHGSRRRQFRALLAGPNTLPPKRRLWGLRANPKYNKAVKKQSRPYARSAWKEKSLYRPAYFLNALTLFLGDQFIIAPEKLLFPLGFIAAKLTGLITTLVMVFDIWRGIRAGDAARKASEKQVSVYRDLDI